MLRCFFGLLIQHAGRLALDDHVVEGVAHPWPHRQHLAGDGDAEKRKHDGAHDPTTATAAPASNASGGSQMMKW